ncbi:uncharacterized protein LOC108677426 [Hyalella azteca]|uniref:Uncharacterized protein LOC108677426 n=1 Tax=Hyalella azteca TaxID=294128 RepID=A0A8B7P506_HYAAZ|nr:uncharacterized protein LOC108677426 [Hyalella azteca]
MESINTCKPPSNGLLEPVAGASNSAVNSNNLPLQRLQSQSSPNQVSSNGVCTSKTLLDEIITKNLKNVQNSSSSQKDRNSSVDPSPLHAAINAKPRLFEVENRFSKMIDNIDSLLKGVNAYGLKKFLRASKNLPITHRKKTVTGSEDENNQLHLEKGDGSVKDSSNEMGTLKDACLDSHASKRCRNFLKGKKCQEVCSKLHRLPKEDGIKCISELYGECYMGNTCIFVHENELNSNEGNVPNIREGKALKFPKLKDKIQNLVQSPQQENTLNATCRGATETSTVAFSSSTSSDSASGNLISMHASSKEHHSSDLERTCADDFLEDVPPNADCDETLENSNPEDEEFIRSPVTETSCSPENAINVSKQTEVGVKRHLDKGMEELEKLDSANKRIKNESGDGGTNKSSSNEVEQCQIIAIKLEEVEPVTVKHELFKYEFIECPPPVKQEECTPKFPDPSGNMEELNSELIISVPNGYKSLPEHILSDVSSLFLTLLKQNSKFKYTVKSVNSYVELFEYLQFCNIPVLDETKHPKQFVWEVHLRLALCALLDVDEAREYQKDIERHLMNDPFNSFLKRTLQRVHKPA